MILRRSIRGSVLVVVLVTLMFATFALVAFVQKAHTDLVVASREAISRNLRQDAYSALEVVVAVLAEFRTAGQSLRSPSEGWDQPLEFAGWTPGEGRTAQVEFEDESGKLSLPHADRATLINLFRSWSLSDAEAERLTDALLDWMKKDFVPGTLQLTSYDRANLPYHAPKRSLRSYRELAAIDVARNFFFDREGLPTEYYQRFVDAVSLFDFSKSNLNGGRTDVLAALGVGDETSSQTVREYLSGRGSYAQSGARYFRSVEDAAGLLGAGRVPDALGTEINALRVRITITQGLTQFHLTAVLAPPEGAKLVEEKSVVEEASSSRSNRSAARDEDEDDDEDDDSGDGSASSKKLNYPFTLLEIQENIEISTRSEDASA